MKLKELRQKRAQLIADARSIVDAAKDGMLGAEDEARYNALMDDANRLKGEITRHEQLEEEERALGQTVGDGNRPDPETRTVRNGDPRASDEYRQAYSAFLRGGVNEMSLAEQRALMAGNDTLGGFLQAPPQFVSGLLQAVDNQVYIRQWADVQQVQGAADGLGLVSLDSDPADPIWTSELGTGDEDSSMAFGQRELHPHPLAKRIKVSRKLLRKVPSVEALVTQRLAYKFAVTMEANYLTGNGAKKPLGVFTASNDGIPTTRDVSTGNTQTSMTFDGLIEAKYALKGQYWGRARWMFHRDGMKQLVKLKDGDGQYIWRESVRSGEPDRLLNLPVFMSEYAPNTFGAGLYVGILGDWSFYKIADDISSMEVQRLVELYAATNQVGLIGRMESDGMPALAEAFVRVKLAP